MKRLVACLLFIAVATVGCAQNHFNIPPEHFATKVKVLGVAPVFLDSDSDISHPQKDLLLPLISDFNRLNEPLLVRKLQSTGNFYAVIPTAEDPKQLFSTLMSRREKRDDAGIQYNKYFWKKEDISNYINKNRLDAVMVVVVGGISKNSTLYSSNLLTSLETVYNFLTITAQILDAEGTVLWEYPNFRSRFLTYYPLMNLQYPDFSQSEANLSPNTEVRYKSIDGIRRTLEKKKNSWLQETRESEAYGRLFDEMTGLIKYSVSKSSQGASVDVSPQRPPLNEPVTTKNPTTVPAPAPVETTSGVATPDKKPNTPLVPSESAVDIVPAIDASR